MMVLTNLILVEDSIASVGFQHFAAGHPILLSRLIHLLLVTLLPLVATRLHLVLLLRYLDHFHIAHQNYYLEPVMHLIRNRLATN
jgi:hypothetical protein